jgi:Icc-related predicted phosphoesterase
VIRCFAPGVFRHSTPERELPRYFGISIDTAENTRCLQNTVSGQITNATYLENTGITLDGVTFWGSPYTPEFLNWAFMYQRGSGARYWNLIPDNLDVLITHGPPLSVLDQAVPGEAHLGCAELLDAVRQKKPRFHIFGHIDGGAGTFESESTRFINAAYLNERYRPLPPAGKIHVIDI